MLRRLLRRAIPAGIVLACTGCAINPPLRVASLAPGASVDLTAQVPFFPQTQHQCGPAALATVLAASGVAATPETLAPQVYLPGRHGSLQVELMGAIRRAGRIPYPLVQEHAALFAELKAGRPVLVLQNLLTPHVPLWHYAVVTGFDPQGNRVRLNSGRKRGIEISGPHFRRTWDWANRWAIVALKPGEMPVRVDATVYLTAVADFETVAGSVAARSSYLAAQRKWPDDARVYLALGNQEYVSGDKSAAVMQYREGLLHAPGDPVLANNYASAMGELGCPAQALQVLDSVQDKTSRWHEQLEQTRAEIIKQSNLASANCVVLAVPTQ